MFFQLTYEVLDPSFHISNVTDPECGAVSLFIGTVRNNFQGKQVIYLDYSAYTKMVHKEVSKIMSETQKSFPRVKHISISHRLGKVYSGESSIVIAVSAPDRVSSINAVSSIIESFKSRVPIWKKEVGEDWSEWKANIEWKPYLINRTNL